MRFTKLLPLLIVATVTSCNLEPSHYKYSDVIIPVTERLVPATAVVNQPFTIYATAVKENGCWSNIRFYFDETDDRQYELFALADFEASGVCPDVMVGADTIITITPKRTGNHVLTVWMDNRFNERDTIVVVEPTPLK
jgi:hypothetical protein